MTLRVQRRVLDDEEESVFAFQLHIKTIDIPWVDEQTHFKPEIIVKGEAIGAEDSAFEKSVYALCRSNSSQTVRLSYWHRFWDDPILAWPMLLKMKRTMPRLAELEINEPRVEVPTVFQLLATNRIKERLELSKPLEPNEYHLVVTETEEAHYALWASAISADERSSFYEQYLLEFQICS